MTIYLWGVDVTNVTIFCSVLLVIGFSFLISFIRKENQFNKIEENMRTNELENYWGMKKVIVNGETKLVKI